MDNSVLRGFCQTCGHPLVFGKEKEYHLITIINPYRKDHKIVPVWFLSAKQIKILLKNKNVWREWAMNRKIKWRPEEGYGDQIACLLDENPFLVAKILKGSEKK